MSTASPLVLPLVLSQPIRQLLISIQNLIQLKSSSFIQICQFFSPEFLKSISSWRFPVRGFPTLLRNHILSNNQALLLLVIIFFLQFFVPLSVFIMFFAFTPYATPNTRLLSASGISLLFGFFHSTQQTVSCCDYCCYYYCYYYYYIIIIIIIIIIYSSILCPTKQKEKRKRLHYLRCGNILFNHGNICFIEPKYEQQVSRP